MRRAMKMVASAVLAVSLVAGPGAAAFAANSGTTATVNGCYATWGSGKAAGHCKNTPKTVKVRLGGDCSGAQAGFLSGWVTVKGTSSPFATASCIWNVTEAYVAFG
ncbi:hypothetical protein [Cellulomonas hominis]